MKKRSVILTATTVLLLFALVFTACGTQNTNGNNNGGDEQPQTVDIYAQLNTMLRNVGYPVTLTSKTTEDGYVFNGTYTITEEGDGYLVAYSYE